MGMQPRIEPSRSTDLEASKINSAITLSERIETWEDFQIRGGRLAAHLLPALHGP